MWGFLKKLFAQEEEKETVNFFELEKYLAEKAWKGISSDIEKLQKIRESITSNLEKLQGKDIDAEKVQDRAKDVIKGNRNAFVIMLRKFADSIEPPKDLNVKTINEFCKTFEAELVNFNEKTIRNYFIMKALIGQELEAINKNLKESEAIVREIKKDIDSGHLALLEDMQMRIKDIYTHIEGKEEKEKEILKLKNETKELFDKEKALTDKISAMKEGKEFAELENLKSELQIKSEEETEVKNRVKSMAAEVARPLRKYEKIISNKHILRFLEEPVEAVKEERELAKIMHSAAESMQKGEIDSKNSEKEIQKLQELSSSIDELKERMLFLEKGKEEIKESIKQNKAEEERDKLIEELSNVERNLAETETRLDSLRKKDIKEDIAKIKEDLRKSGFKLELKNVPYQ
ncbi:MAG: hypothetical protein V1734_01900 [Nanoarchaeota archaeon]